MANKKVIGLYSGFLQEIPTTDNLILGTITTGVWNASLIVPQYGGTGLGSLTPYALLTGGTTSTGTLQQVSGVGTSGQTLVSNGAGQLPTWQTSTALTNPMTHVGDIIIGGTAGAPTRLAVGTALQALLNDGTNPVWSSQIVNQISNDGSISGSGNGLVSISINTSHANTWSGIQTFNAGKAVLAAGTTALAPLTWTVGSAALLSSVVQATEEVDSSGLKYYTNETTAGRGYVPAEQHFRLTSNGGTISTIANFFGANSNPTLVSGAEYLIEIECYYTNTTSGTVTWTFTNSAAPTLQNIYCKFSPVGGIVAPAGSASAGYLEGNIQGNSTAAEALTTTGTLTTATTQYAYFKFRLINGTGTSLKIQATKLVGGTITPLAGSYWRCTRLPAANVGTFSA